MTTPKIGMKVRSKQPLFAPIPIPVSTDGVGVIKELFGRLVVTFDNGLTLSIDSDDQFTACYDVVE